MRELRPGLWHWEALHPQWDGSVQRGQAVSSYAMDDGDRLLLFDPMLCRARSSSSQLSERLH